MAIHIKAACQSDFPALQEIELAAFETLRAAGAVTGPAGSSTNEDLQMYLDAGFLFAAFGESSGPVGFAGASIEDGWLHIWEVDVHPRWQRNGIGRNLMHALLLGGRQKALAGASLTTDIFAPFNAKFYASLGFGAVPGDTLPPGLRAFLDAEVKKGFDPRRRLAMTMNFK